MTKTQQEFINSVAPGAQAAQKKYGIFASLTIAQAILESAFGKSGLTKKCFNLFGIKWTSTCGYPYMEFDTAEYTEDRKKYYIKARFRKYKSFAESIDDHSKLLTYSRYTPVREAKDYKEACLKIRECGYATDPEYGKELISLIEAYNLTKYDTGKAPLFKTVTAFVLNVREKPNGKVVGTKLKGAKVEVSGASGEWTEIEYKGKKGYVFTKYLKGEK